MYDIVINKDGCPLIENGDFVPASYAQYIGQKIYNALMNIRADFITGISIDHHDRIEGTLRDYFSACFMGDLDVDPAHIRIKTVPLPGSDTIHFSLFYTGTSPTGEDISYRSDLDFSFSQGALIGTNFTPPWLSTPDAFDKTDVVFPIRIREVTREIELPLEPLRESSPGAHAPIYLLEKNGLPRVKDTFETSFTIPIHTLRSKYPIRAYLSGESVHALVIEEYAVTENALELPFYVITEYGDGVIVVPKGCTGTIQGRATVRPALQKTATVSLKHEMAFLPLFPLQRSPGKYFALFPKTIHNGDYYIVYTGISEVR